MRWSTENENIVRPSQLGTLLPANNYAALAHHLPNPGAEHRAGQGV